jgi:ribonuclease P protein component
MAPGGLRKNAQFRRVYTEGHRTAGERIIIYWLGTGDSGIHPGFVASKKKAGSKAHQRNRAKRLMREVFRTIRDRIEEKDLWIVFIASFDPERTSFGQLLEDVERSLTRAGLITGDG